MKKANRLPGFFYLGMVIFGVCAQIIRSNIIVFVDDIDTWAKLGNSIFALRLAFVSDILMTLFYVLTAWALYNALKQFDKNLSLLFLLLAAVSAAVLCSNMIHFFAIIEMNQAEYFSSDNLQNQKQAVQFFFNMYDKGYYSSQLFFGLWLLPIGLIILKFKIMPAYFGIMLIAATAAHIIEFFIVFLYPKGAVITYPGLVIGMLGEFSFCFWLLFRGLSKEPDK